MISYQLKQARQSELCNFPTLICYIDYRKIGTHEKANVDKQDGVTNSIKSRGWMGPAISVFRKSSDDTELKNNQVLDVQYGEYGVADGHHRLASIRSLDDQGLLKELVIPVQVVSARGSLIRISTQNNDERPLSLDEVEACFSDKTKIIPEGTSHFQTILKNKVWVRLREAQPDLVITKDDLITS